MTASPVAVVTGASRGAGRGIAIALGSHGCTVYVTGRSEKAGDHPLPGTIWETADAVTQAGGKGIAVRVDHADDSQVESLFAQVLQAEGRLDILVNNACALHDDLTAPGNFWEKPLGLVEMLNVGLRSAYVASVHAAPLMVAQRHGLIMFTSASGAVHYSFGPAYGAHKAGMDKFAADMAVDLRPFNVAALSIWMGALLTDRLRMVIASDPIKYRDLEAATETPEFTGHAIWALYSDPALMDRSGQAVIGAEMAVKYGFADQGGRQPRSCRDTHHIAPRQQYPLVLR
ncbi:NAD(P)-dependent dehydrogenase (short-subunit alcohol dehydrogenase family) [Sphingobium xenophagum]|uniref:NAD(P)-dependent dehydrogenase (Short-subunit alcohol dehydrogenase family) n=1 Tax=Sphingobium xenophagum TaxID=121428 RepID=A0ABU1X6Y9_SPHXE|nr:SDR family NAD(P)-dependent oxidoreductase [Sphingobium xenophagum]MDR7157244.1 NAD(P)-dependent dehydrogenase (short-subunit alcohol dehydrogenase family) [Sphingobium xenophagum]